MQLKNVPRLSATALKSFVLATAFISQTAFAQVAEISQIFASTFHSGYRNGYCGDNVMNLIKRANEAGLDVSRARIVTITNGGITVFGMVNAEYVRNQGKLLPKPTPEGIRLAPGESNWYHHVVLELDGAIFDFDFGNEPRVIDVATYFQKMFLEEKTVAEGGKFYAGPEKKLDQYVISLLSAQDYLNRVRQPNEVKLKMREFLNAF